jgi:hypothetical protein
MKGAEGDSFFVFSRAADAGSHLVCGFVSKGDRQYFLGSDTLAEEVQDSGGNHPSLSSAGTGKDQNGPVRSPDRFKLLWIEIKQAHGMTENRDAGAKTTLVFASNLLQ